MRKKKNADQVVEIAEEMTLSESAKIQEFLQNVIEIMGLNCTVELSEVDEAVAFNIVGEDASHVIGYRGETLDALQYLCSLLLNGRHEGFKRVNLDAEGYRSRREKALQKLARNLESKVKRTGREHKLEPMNPYERRIIHTTLQGSQYVTTQSEGQGAARHVVITPIKQNNVLNSPNAPRKTLNFVYRSEKKRRR